MKWKFWQPDYERLDHDPSADSELGSQGAPKSRQSGQLDFFKLSARDFDLGIHDPHDPSKDRVFDDEAE